MIQYTGTSSRSNYNDERTATIGRPSELLRRLGVGSRPVFHLLSPLGFPPCRLPYLTAAVDFLLSSRCSSLILFALLSSRSPPPVLVLLFLLLHLLLLLLLLLLILPYSRRSLRRIAPQQEQTSPRGRHGATESRWMDLSLLSLSLSPSFSLSILRNYHGGHREGSLGRKCVISGIRAR